MADDTEILSARFEGDIPNLKEAAADAKKATADWEKAAEKHLGGAAKSFRNLSAIGASSLAGLGAGLAGVFTVSQIRALAEASSRIGDVSEAVGLSTSRYQELSNAVRLAGVGQVSFNQAVTFFAQQMGDLRRNTGSFYDFLRQSLPDVLNQVQATRSQSEAFDVVAEATRRLTDAESRAVLVREAFGRGSTGLTVALKDGVGGLDAAAKSAGRYAVVSEGAIKNTKRLLDAFDELGIQATASLQEAIGEMSGPMLLAIEGISKALAEVRAKQSGAAGGVMAAANQARAAKGQLGPWETKSAEGDEKPLFFSKQSDTQALDQINKLQAQLAAARGEVFSQIDAEAAQSLAAIIKLQQQNLVAEGDYIEARALIDATADAKRAETRKQTDTQLEQLRITALDADNQHFAALKAQYDLDEKAYKELQEKKIISEEQFAAARANLQAVADQKLEAATGAAWSRAGDVISSSMSDITAAMGSESDKQFRL